jgi:predicted Zn-dependent protease
MRNLLIGLLLFVSLTSSAIFDPKRDTFYIRGYGNVDNSDLTEALDIIKSEFGFICKILPPLEIDSKNIIQNSTHILEVHQTLKSLKVDSKTLYITEKELWTNRMYVRGYSFLNGNVLIVRGDKKILRETIIHEIGHIFGLDHCGDMSCIMAINNDDFDSGKFCNRCNNFLKFYPKIR